MARAVLRGGETAVDTPLGAVLVRGVLPGERARLVDVARRGGALRGRVAERLTTSGERVVPPCEVQERCGGCPLMIWRIDAQRAWKRALVAEAVGLSPSNVIMVAGPDLGYRRRARLVFAEGRVGYRAARSTDLIEPARCVILSPPLSVALGLIRKMLLPMLAGAGELRLSATRGARAVLEIEGRGAQTPAVYSACAGLAGQPGIAGVSLHVGDSAPATWGELGDARLFSQAHGEINAALVQHVARLAETRDARVLELYAGHGNLTFALAAGALEVVAVERDARAVAAGAAHARAHGFSHVRFVVGDAAEPPVGPRFDVVVLDPPRTGAKEALSAIAARRPARIVYVSCDTATLQRDVGALRALGYAPDAAVALDMFPQTAQVESVVRLVATARGAS